MEKREEQILWDEYNTTKNMNVLWPLFKSLEPLMHKFIRNKEIGDHTVDDLVQEMYLLCIKCVPEYLNKSKGERFITLMYTAMWQRLGHIKKYYKNSIRSGVKVDNEVLYYLDNGQDVEKDLIQEKYINRIDEILSREWRNLSELSKNIIMDFIIHGYKLHEISKKYGVEYRLVQHNWLRNKKMIIDNLERY